MRVLRIMLVAALVGAVPAAAFAGGDGSGNGGVGGDDNVFAAVQGIHYGHPPSGTGADSSGCHWLRDSSGIIDDAFFANDKVIGGVTYKAFLKSCPGALPVLVWVPQLSARGVAQAALDYVTERLPAPTLLSAPSADKGVVGVGMWFWTDPVRYRSVSVTAWIPGIGGPIWATTTAVPTALAFDSGDAERGGASLHRARHRVERGVRRRGAVAVYVHLSTRVGHLPNGVLHGAPVDSLEHFVAVERRRGRRLGWLRHLEHAADDRR